MPTAESAFHWRIRLNSERRGVHSDLTGILPGLGQHYLRPRLRVDVLLAFRFRQRPLRRFFCWSVARDRSRHRSWRPDGAAA